MPRYFFHLRNYIDDDDEEGLVLADLDAALVHAGKYAIAEAAETVLEHHRFNPNYAVLIADEAGAIVLTVKFGDVVKLES